MYALARSSPERRRLNELLDGGAGGGVVLAAGPQSLTDRPTGGVEKAARLIPKSPKDMSRLQRRMAAAGYRSFKAAVAYSFVELVTPVIAFVAVLAYLGLSKGLILAILAAMVGYLIPGLWLTRQIEKRKKQIQNGLPDALDLLIVCIEAGSSLDQGVVKASDELAIAYPALAEELRMLTTEIRAGKPRLEAFKNFAARTKVDDVRALVAMMIQTDRFGTSIAQALRTHADTSRTKRRQRAEEKAAKLGVKLVFPLVLCLFPAFYVVTLGPAIIQFLRVFIQGVAAQ
jgi:tight adherence protein C